MNEDCIVASVNFVVLLMLRGRRMKSFTVFELNNIKTISFLCLNFLLCAQLANADQNPFTFELSFAKVALQKLHQLGLECLKNSKSPYGYHSIPLHSAEEREIERQRIWKMTKGFLSYPGHVWRGFTGPWIEDLWISHFSNMNISEFGPYVPIFFPWVNVCVGLRHSNVTYQMMIRPILQALKPDFMYITVNFNDSGVEGQELPNPDIPPNLLIISASGRGHIAIFLHYFPRDWVDMLPITNKIVFAGNLRRPQRSRLVHKWKDVFKENLTVSNRNDDWITMFRSHELVLSPRGNARGTFRTNECLQMGLIPIITFNSVKWVPFMNSSLPWEDLAFIVLGSEIEDFKKTVDSLTPERLAFMRQTIRKYKYSHFTIEATVRHIELFLKYGYEKSDLRCGEYYHHQ